MKNMNIMILFNGRRFRGCLNRHRDLLKLKNKQLKESDPDEFYKTTLLSLSAFILATFFYFNYSKI